ncbi:MAG: heavy metal transport/detoxification protein [Chitinophagaceae bacterium]|nr:heavy metal transport/detoxification protein [Chitinophagaceae bacterium]
MKQFKTNIMCNSCISKVTPVLNKTVGEGKWSVDLKDPKRVLTIGDEADEKSVVESLKEVGYKAEALS